MRAIVCGGRRYADYKRVAAVLAAHGITELAHGNATGADRLADRWATANGVPARPYSAMWSIYGPSAGPRRNATMLFDFKPDAVIAFPGGDGTADMVAKANAAGVRVIEVTP